MGAWDGQIFLIGGDSDFFIGGTSNEVNIYDIASGAWVGNGASMPAAAVAAGFVQVGEHVYVVGGWGDASPGSNVDVTQRYDLSADGWETGPSFDSARSDLALAATSENLYAIGGDANGGSFFDSSNLVEALDYAAWPGGAWTDTDDPLPTGLTAMRGGFCTQAVTGGEVWSLGGIDPSFFFVGTNQYRSAEACVTLDVTWLSEDPVEGALAANGGSLDITLNFDAGVPEVPQPGDYLATLKVNSDTPYEALQVPITMTVVAPATWGKVTGTVTGLGYCDAAGGPLEGAEVLIESNNTVYSVIVETDANGSYTHWLDSANSSLTVTASFPGYLSQTAEGVVVTPGGTTTQDFDLRLPAPCASVPSLLSSLQLPENQAVVQLTITNDGASDLDWSLGEGPTAPEPQLPASGPPERVLPAGPIVPDVKSQVAPLADVIQDGGFETGTPNAFWDEFSTNFGTPLCDAASCGTGGGTAGPHSGSWWAWFGGIDAFEQGTLSQDVVIGSGTATLTFWLWIGASAGTGNDFLDVSLDGDVLFSVTDTTPGYGSYTQVALDVSAYADGGTHTLTFDSIAYGGGVTNMSVDDVALDVVEEGPPPAACGVDIPWLTVSQRRGTTPPDSSSAVNLTFDSTGLEEGFYTGILCLSSNDPVNPEIEIAVTLVVYFQDVPPGAFAFDHIIALADSGVTAGCAADLYCPDDSTTRGQMAVFLLKGIEGADYVPPDAVGLFDDVPVTHPFADWIEELYNRGITAGCSAVPLLYCPADPVTRGQMAVFLLKSVEGAGYLPPDAVGIFDDVPVTHPFADWIEELYNRGITAGCSADPLLYCPADPTTRAQMAVFLVLTFDLPLPEY